MFVQEWVSLCFSIIIIFGSIVYSARLRPSEAAAEAPGGHDTFLLLLLLSCDFFFPVFTVFKEEG